MREQLLLILCCVFALGLVVIAIQKVRLKRRGVVCPSDLSRKSKSALGIFAVVYTALVIVAWSCFGTRTVLEWGVAGVLVVCIGWTLVVIVKDTKSLSMKNPSNLTSAVPHKR